MPSPPAPSGEGSVPQLVHTVTGTRVAPPSGMSWPASRILVATDFSPSAQAALEVTADLGRRTGAAIDVVHAVRDPAQLVTGYEIIDELLRGRSDPRELQREARDRLEEPMRTGALRGNPLLDRTEIEIDVLGIEARHLETFAGKRQQLVEDQPAGRHDDIADPCQLGIETVLGKTRYTLPPTN